MHQREHNSDVTVMSQWQQPAAYCLHFPLHLTSPPSLPSPFPSHPLLLLSPLPPSFTGLHEGNAESKFTRCSEGKRETDFRKCSSCVRLPPWVSWWQLRHKLDNMVPSLSLLLSSTFVKILEEASESPEDIAKCFLNQVSHMMLPCIT